jgi:hypothetical protein
MLELGSLGVGADMMTVEKEIISMWHLNDEAWVESLSGPMHWTSRRRLLPNVDV